MSLDYPYYEELCHQKHRAAWWWLVGDRLYYLGLLSAMISLPLAGVGLIEGLFGSGWHRFWISLVIFPSGAIVLITGSSLKAYAYRLAERDGISSAEVYSRGALSQRVDAEDSPYKE